MYKGLFLRMFVSIVIICSFLYFFFGPAYDEASPHETELFVVPQSAEHFDVTGELKKQGFVRNEWMTRIILEGAKIEPGGYRLKKSMWLWQTTFTVKSKPSLGL